MSSKYTTRCLRPRRWFLIGAFATAAACWLQLQAVSAQERSLSISTIDAAPWSLTEPKDNSNTSLEAPPSFEAEDATSPPMATKSAAGDSAVSGALSTTISAPAAGRVAASPMLLSSLSPESPFAGIATLGTRQPDTIQMSRRLLTFKHYTLLDGSLSMDYFNHESSADEALLPRWMANSLPLASGVAPTPRPLFELKIGNWRLPVRLSGTQPHDSGANRW